MHHFVEPRLYVLVLLWTLNCLSQIAPCYLICVGMRHCRYVDQLPTWSSDRTCASCNTSCTTQAADVVFMIDSTGSIEEPIFGGSPGNFQLMIDFARRVAGDPAMFGGSPPNPTVFRLPHCAMSDTQALQGTIGSKFASIVWSDDAVIDFDFNEYGYDMASLGQGLQNTPYFGNETSVTFCGTPCHCIELYTYLCCLFLLVSPYSRMIRFARPSPGSPILRTTSSLNYSSHLASIHLVFGTFPV